MWIIALLSLRRKCVIRGVCVCVLCVYMWRAGGDVGRGGRGRQLAVCVCVCRCVYVCVRVRVGVLRESPCVAPRYHPMVYPSGCRCVLTRGVSCCVATCCGDIVYIDASRRWQA